MTIDQRARRAVDALNRAVAETPMGRPVTSKPAPIWSMAAGALVAAALLAVFFVSRPEVTAPEFAASTTTRPTTVTTPPEPVVVPPTTLAESTTTSAAPATTPAPDLEPPPLTITFPQPGHVSETKTIRFEGTTEAGATVTAGRYAADVDAEGNWSITLVLGEGTTTARFVATDAAGNSSTASVAVEFAPPATATTKPAEVAPFKAFFTWGECAIDPPYDEYYGKGEPGSTITVTSPYGGGSTVVKESGEWYVKVEFPEAPSNKTFVVKVIDSLGRKAAFEFTSRVGG